MGANIVVNLLLPLLIFIGLATWNFTEGGGTAVSQGLVATVKMFGGVMVAVFIAFLITGQAQVLAERHMVKMLEFLGGKHGVWGAAAAGVVAPTLSTYPIVQDLWQQKAVSLGVVMSVVVSTRLLNIQSVLFFLPFLGWQLTLISIGVGIALTIVFVSITKIIG